MSGFKIPVILYFIAGMNPTKEEGEDAARIGAVRFRNVSAMSANDKAERNVDGVAGDPDCIPVQYADYQVVNSLGDVMEIMQRKQEEEKAQEDAAANSVNPGVEVVGKGGKAKKEKGKGQVASPAWSPNA